MRWSLEMSWARWTHPPAEAGSAQRVVRIEHRDRGMSRIVQFQRHLRLGNPWMSIELPADDLEVIRVAVKRVGAGVDGEKSSAVADPLVKDLQIHRQIAGGVEDDD